MAQFGNVSVTFDNWRSFGWNSENMVSIGPFSFPEAGTVTSLSAYHAQGPGAVGTINWQAAIWDGSSNAVIASSSIVGLPAGSDSTNGQALQTVTLSAALTAGQSVRFGWWRSGGTGSSTDDDVMSYRSTGGTFQTSTQANTSGVQAWSTTSTYTGLIQLYMTYTPSGGGTPLTIPVAPWPVISGW